MLDIALLRKDVAAVAARLKARGVDYDLRRLVGRGHWQLFLRDPDGARVELDFAAEETR